MQDLELLPSHLSTTFFSFPAFTNPFVRNTTLHMYNLVLTASPPHCQSLARTR